MPVTTRSQSRRPKLLAAIAEGIYINHIEQIWMKLPELQDIPTYAHFLCLMATNPILFKRFFYRFMDEIAEVTDNQIYSLYTGSHLMLEVECASMDPKLQKLLQMWGYDERALAMATNEIQVFLQEVAHISPEISEKDRDDFCYLGHVIIPQSHQDEDFYLNVPQ